MASDLNDLTLDLGNEDISFEILQEMERQTQEEIRRLRAHERLAIKTRVVVQPGNSSQMLNLKVQGVTGDISAGGCRAMFPFPLGVGDIYRLQFQEPELQLPLIFARCMRCRVIREDAYEAGFSFFTSITLPQLGKAIEEESLV